MAITRSSEARIASLKAAISGVGSEGKTSNTPRPCKASGVVLKAAACGALTSSMVCFGASAAISRSGRGEASNTARKSVVAAGRWVPPVPGLASSFDKTKLPLRRSPQRLCEVASPVNRGLAEIAIG